MLPGVRGYVLAGGESSRMQSAGLPQDKAMLLWQGLTLLDRAVATVQQVCNSHRVLCGSAERGARLGLRDDGISDRSPGSGPLGGLESALADAEQAGIPWALLLPVDLPWMTATALLAFGRSTLPSGGAAAWMQTGKLPQPLPALVSSAAGPLVHDMLQRGQRKLLPALQAIVQGLTPQLRKEPIAAETLLGEGSGSRWFWNVNTPGDYHLLQQDETLQTGPHQSTHG